MSLYDYLLRSQDVKGYHVNGRQMDVRDYERVLEGECIVILGNGPSCRMFDLAKLADCYVIGLNRAWELRECDFYCAGDREQFARYERVRGNIESWAPLFTTEVGPPHAVHVKGHHVNGRKGFSFRLGDGVYLNNTIVSFGLQLAVYMLGMSGTIYLLGIDCTGPNLDGGKIPHEKFENQRETLGYLAGVIESARPGIKVLNLSPVSESRVFERASFHEVFP